MKLKKQITMIAAISLGCVILAGCATTTYGVNNNAWKAMTPKEQQIAMKHYYTQQERQQEQQARVNRINAQNAPINNIISALGGAVNNAGNHHKKCVTDNFGNTVCGYNCYIGKFGSAHCAIIVICFFSFIVFTFLIIYFNVFTPISSGF